MDKIKIYLGGPIDMYDSFEDAQVLRNEVKKLLDPEKFQFFDPVTNKRIGVHYTASEICQSDLHFLKRSDLLLVLIDLPEFIPSKRAPIGTPMELVYAFLWHIPIIAVTNCLAGRAWWDYHVAKNFTNVEEAVDYIKITFANSETNEIY